MPVRKKASLPSPRQSAHIMRKATVRLFFGVIMICLFAASMQTMAATAAGTKLTAVGSATYYSSAGTLMPTATSNTVTTTVGATAGVSVSPTSLSKTGTSGSPVTFSVTITNTGGDSDTIGLSTSSLSGSTVTVYKDDNSDGILQSTETTKVSSTGALAAGSSFKCIVSVTLPSSKTTDTVTLTATSGADSTKTAKAALTVTSSSAATYIQTWLLNAYYANTSNTTRLSTDYLSGEAKVTPSEGSTSGGKTWTKLTSASSVIDLAGAYANPTQCAGYAVTYVYSPTAQSANLWLGSDNGIKAWVNGTVVWTNDSTRGYTADQDKVAISLNSGWNTLLLKISQYGGAWCFSAKIGDSSGNAISGITYSVVPPATAPPVISNGIVTPGSTSALIEWDTDQPSTTIVDYGTTTALGQEYSDGTMVTHHAASLSGLSASTAYNFNVGSANTAGNVAWYNNHTFTTLSATAGGPYIENWLVNGYYSNTNNSTRLSTDYLSGEASVTPTEGGASGGKTWTLLSSTAPRIDLAPYYNNPLQCAGYAVAYVYSPTAQSANLLLGSDNGIKAWVNGTVVWTNDSTRGYTADQDKVSISLKAGWNTLLLKISQYGGNWCFSAKICDSNGNQIPSLYYSTAP